LHDALPPRRPLKPANKAERSIIAANACLSTPRCGTNWSRQCDCRRPVRPGYLPREAGILARPARHARDNRHTAASALKRLLAASKIGRRRCEEITAEALRRPTVAGSRADKGVRPKTAIRRPATQAGARTGEGVLNVPSCRSVR